MKILRVSLMQPGSIIIKQSEEHYIRNSDRIKLSVYVENE